jgi:hypothetical protein
MVNLKFNGDFKSHINFKMTKKYKKKKKKKKDQKMVLSLFLFLLVGNLKLFFLIKVLALTTLD